LTALIVALAVFHPSPACGAASVRTDRAVYRPGESIRVLFSGAPGDGADWICIVPASSPDTDAGDYKYMPQGQSQGALSFDAPQPGKYEARAYYHYRRQGYVVSARYAFSVVAREQTGSVNIPSEKKLDPGIDQDRLQTGGLPVRTDRAVYRPGESIRVLFSGAPGDGADWICIVPASSPDTDAGDYKYMPQGQSQGGLSFDAPQPGKYEARAYYHYRRQGYVVSARYAFSVADRDQTGSPDMSPEEEGGPPIAAPPPPEADAGLVAAPPQSDQPDLTATAPETKSEPEIVRQDVPPSGYTLEYEQVISHMKGGSFEAALFVTDKIYQRSIGAGGAKQDKYLKLLERGKLALAARKYEQCISDLQQAEIRFLTIEGTFSITEGLGSLVTDDTVQEYEPEMHEKLMIPPYLVLAYLGKGDLEGARVERNKTINRIHQYIEENPERAYLENSFARFLSAVVYEMEGKPDDAKIEYRKMKLDDEVARLERRQGSSTDLIVFVDVGMAPRKYEVKYGPTTVIAAGGSVTLGFAYAGYNAVESAIADCTIKINGEPIGNTTRLYDVEKTIFSQYERNKSAMMGKLIARMTGKTAAQVGAQMAAEQLLKNVPFGGLFAKAAIGVVSSQWIAAEKADLRSWISLPRQVQYIRVHDLMPGEHSIGIEYNGGSQVQKVILKEGQIHVAYFSVTP